MRKILPFILIASLNAMEGEKPSAKVPEKKEFRDAEIQATTSFPTDLYHYYRNKTIILLECGHPVKPTTLLAMILASKMKEKWWIYCPICGNGTKTPFRELLEWDLIKKPKN
jgi:hypothetical protein